MNFEIISEITEVKTIFVGDRIRDVARLRKMYGKARWRKVKAVATVRLQVVGFGWRSYIGTKRMESGARK